MKTIKSLVLGSAAALVAMGGAQAADLPVKAKAVEYVKVCSLYGAGFYYIPGTDTCIKFGGYLRVDLAVNENLDNIGNVAGQAGAKNRLTNGYTWRSREDFNTDTRTQTEYGVLRTYADFTFTWTSDSYLQNANGSTVYAPLAVGTSLASLPNNAGAGNNAYGTVGVYFAFIQFAGFTIGKAISQFSMPWVNYPANNFDGLVGGGGTVTGVNQFTYTFDLGGGNTFALSAQDSAATYISGNNNLGGNGNGVSGSALANYGAGDTAGFISPDFVAMFRSDQAAYAFQFSAALHDNHVAYYGSQAPFAGATNTGTELSGHPSDLWGFAVAGGFTLKNLPTGPGDTFNAQAVYTHGATRYNIQDLATLYGTPLLFGSTSNPLAYQSFAFNAAPDTVFVNGGSQHAITTYGGQAGFNHNWNPFWSSGFYGAAAAVRFDDASKLAICGPNGNFNGTLLTGLVFGVDGSSGTGVCNPNYEIYQAGFITRWTPVKGLTFSGDLTWSRIDQHNQGLANFASGTLAKPTAVYQFKNEDNVLLLLRAQRNF